MKVEALSVENQAASQEPRTPGEWLARERRRDPDLDLTLFQAELARGRTDRFMVPDRIRRPEDLQALVQMARDWVRGNSVPTVGISGWKGEGQPFGLALAQPRLEFVPARKGKLRPDTVEALRRLFGRETRAQFLRQAEGALRSRMGVQVSGRAPEGEPAIYDILFGHDLTLADVQAELAMMEEKEFPESWAELARAINGTPAAKAEGKKKREPEVRKVVPFFQPREVVQAQVPAASAKAYLPGRGWALVGAAGVVGLALAACGAQPTPAPNVEISPTTWAQATATETGQAAPTATAEPTEAPTQAATATAEPTATARPTETAVPTEESMVADGLDLPEGEYHFENLRGIRHLLDKDGKLLAVEGAGGEWINLENMRLKFVEYLDSQSDDHEKVGDVTDGGSLYEDKYGNLVATGFVAGVSVRNAASIDLGDQGVLYPHDLVPVYVIDQDGKLGVVWVGVGYSYKDGKDNWWWFDDVSNVWKSNSSAVDDFDQEGKKMLRELHQAGGVANILLRQGEGSNSLDKRVTVELKSMIPVLLSKLGQDSLQMGDLGALASQEFVFSPNTLYLGYQSSDGRYQAEYLYNLLK